RPQVEVLADESLDLVLVDRRRAERLDGDRGRVRDSDGVRHLHLKPLRETSGDDVLGNVTRGVCPGPVDLRRVLAAEGAAAVPRDAAVGVDDDLAAGETGIAHRSAGDEATGGVD